MSRVMYLTVAILCAAMGLIFHLRNRQTVELDYLLGTVEIDLSWALVGAVICGAFFGVLGMSSTLLRMRRRLVKLEKRAAAAERGATSESLVSLHDAD